MSCCVSPVMEIQDDDWDDLLLDEMSDHFDRSCDVEERIKNQISLVGLLVADHEPLQSVVKDVLRALWSNMGTIKVLWAKENVYSISVGDEVVARRLMDGSPWFIKGFTFTIKSWPLYHSLDDIIPDRAIFWVQAHGLPRNMCSHGSARKLRARIGSVMEIEDVEEVGFRGFLRMRIDLDASKPLPSGFSIPCQVTGRRKIRLRYEGVKEFCMRCGRLGHSIGCMLVLNPRLESDGWKYDEGMRDTTISKRSTFLFQPRVKKPVIGGVDHSHWQHRLEKEDGGIYGFSGELGDRQNQGLSVTNRKANATSASTDFLQIVGSVQTVVPQALVLSHASPAALLLISLPRLRIM